MERWRIQIAEWAEGYHELDEFAPDTSELEDDEELGEDGFELELTRDD